MTERKPFRELSGRADGLPVHPTLRCKHCRLDLPAFTMSQVFTDPKTGKSEYHPLAMAKWLAGQDGRLEPDIVEFHYAHRSSKVGLVTGYEYIVPDRWGHEGRGEFCSIKCAGRAHLEGRAEQEPQPIAGTIPANITGRRLQQIRRQLKLSTGEFALALGYEGAEKQSRETIMRRFECGARPIPVTVQRLACMFELFGIPRGARPFDVGKLEQRSLKL